MKYEYLVTLDTGPEELDDNRKRKSLIVIGRILHILVVGIPHGKLTVTEVKNG